MALKCLRKATLPFCLLIVGLYSPTSGFAQTDPPVLESPAGGAWPFFNFALKGESNASYVIESSTNLFQWESLDTNRAATASRRIEFFPVGPMGSPENWSPWRFYRAHRVREPLFSHAIAAIETVHLDGNNVVIDSFDSADSAFSTDGFYDPIKNKDGGDVAVNSNLTNCLEAGNSQILGRLYYRPGRCITLGPAGTVGDKAWIASGNTGIQPGWAADNADLHPIRVDIPFGGGYTPTGGTMDGKYYDFLLFDGDYRVATLHGSVRVLGNAAISVSSNLNFRGAAFLEISPGASLKLYAGGTSASIATDSIFNRTGNATNFQYYGLPTNREINLYVGSPGSTNQLVGVIYAPDADLIQFSGNIPFHFIGASFTRTARFDGAKVHFDENLKRNGPHR